jgi:hypothetical protein
MNINSYSQTPTMSSLWLYKFLRRGTVVGNWPKCVVLNHLFHYYLNKAKKLSNGKIRASDTSCQIHAACNMLGLVI